MNIGHRKLFWWALAVATILIVGEVSFYRTYATREAVASEGFTTGTFAGVSFTIELATTTAAQERGLGGRTNVPDRYGMLFVFPKSGFYGFWMKNTLVPLDMFWLDGQGRVVYQARDVATSTYPNVFFPSASARYVLETNAGFARTHRVATGTPLLLKDFPTVSK